LTNPYIIAYKLKQAFGPAFFYNYGEKKMNKITKQLLARGFIKPKEAKEEKRNKKNKKKGSKK
jgi:hypothetical protein